MVPKKKFTTEIIARDRSILQYAFILTASFLICIVNTPAYSIDFVTKEDFAADQSIYKDYPIKLLFKKLAESDASGKKEIRNIIILKQVFDPNAQKKDVAAVPKYKETFGIIKEISENKLKVWLPETDSYMDYYLGIDRIPTEKSSKYKITESDIGKYTSVIYTLDERVYKIKIDFLLASPTNLYVKHKDDKNIVGWSEASTEEKPLRYKLFRNGEPFGTVEGTVSDVPREKGKVDSYFVKAVYKRGNVLVESEASDVIRDEITLKESQQERLAGETYDRIIAALNPEGYEGAKKLLYDNRQLLDEHLDQNRMGNVKTLTAFFQDIEEGDRLGAQIPETEEILNNALTSFKNAEQKSKSLPDNINVLFLANQKIDMYQNKKAILAESNQKELAAKKEAAREEARLKEQAAKEEAAKEEVRLKELKEEAAREEARLKELKEETAKAIKEASKVPTVEIAGETEQPEEKYDRDAMILLALKDFDDKNYTSSWNTFSKIFRAQIKKIRQGGKNQITGVLALPVECRAEIFFLMELEQLKNSEDGKGITKQGIERIKDKIDNREGLWVIINDSTKRKKIKQHISGFNIDSFK